MSRYNLIKNGEIVNNIEADENFIESIRAEYDDVVLHEEINSGELFESIIPDLPPKPPTSVSAVTFKLLFTSSERVSIYDSANSDPVIKDWLSILDDVRLTTVELNLSSTISVVNYLATKGLIANNRVNQILSGKIQ